ncbi:MAG: SH3 domain-containing protein, partial [SAR324 cluster bacterium]|nr:SH3 domain-containing protein [SAR324 cluster bacterium]
GIFAKEEIRYVKGLGAVLREQPSIQSKKLTKLSRGTKVLALEAKGIWHKVIAGEIQGWLVRGQITNIPVKIKKLVLGQKIRLTSSSGRRIRLRTFSAIVGVKGLVDSKGKKISPYQTDYAALEWLENQPSDEENSVLFLTLSE